MIDNISIASSYVLTNLGPHFLEQWPCWSSGGGRRQRKLHFQCILPIMDSYELSAPITFPSVCDQPGKNLWKYSAVAAGIEPGPRGGQTVRYIHSPTELSWPEPRRGQTVRYINSPTELSWSGPQGGQTVRYNHSSTELSWLTYAAVCVTTPLRQWGSNIYRLQMWDFYQLSYSGLTITMYNGLKIHMNSDNNRVCPIIVWTNQTFCAFPELLCVPRAFVHSQSFRAVVVLHL